jgi:hypothetical protein
MEAAGAKPVLHRGTNVPLQLTSAAGALQVPFTVLDEEIPDDWQCKQNIWDKGHASCGVPQALSDEQIDEILALQVLLVITENDKMLAPIWHAEWDIWSLFGSHT